MSLDHLTQFLERFKRITPPDGVIRNRFVSIVSDMVGGQIDVADVNVVRSTIVLSVPNILKNEIFLRRTEILNQLKSEFGEKAPIDIR